MLDMVQHQEQAWRIAVGCGQEEEEHTTWLLLLNGIILS